MINMLFFLMGFAVMIMFISPMKGMIDIAQNSGNLNCVGYIQDGSASNPLSFNATLNNNQSGSPISCLVIKMYLPYILMAFLIGGVFKLLYDRGSDMFSGGQQDQYGGY